VNWRQVIQHALVSVAQSDVDTPVKREAQPQLLAGDVHHGRPVFTVDGTTFEGMLQSLRAAQPQPQNELGGARSPGWHFNNGSGAAGARCVMGGGHDGEYASRDANKLVQGDLNPSMDFRSFYSTILSKWFGQP
jgi:hypothetical protein